MAAVNKTGVKAASRPPRAPFVISLANGKQVTVAGSGAAGLDVKDGSLLVLESNGRATIAIAPGLWKSVNIDVS